MIGRYTTRAGIMSIDRQYLTVIETNWRQEKNSLRQGEVYHVVSEFGS
jgi:hypothetical protein